MKEFKLNSALAVVLSLGIVCSSSVCAWKKGEQIPNGLPEELVALAESNPKKYNRAGIILDSFELYKEKCEDLMLQDNFLKNRIDRSCHAKKICELERDIDKESAKTLNTYLCIILDGLLSEISSLSRNWSLETKRWFDDRNWKYVPENMEEFILMVKNSNSFSFLLDILNRICSELDSSPEKLESEKKLFPVFVEVTNEIARTNSIMCAPEKDMKILEEMCGAPESFNVPIEKECDEAEIVSRFEIFKNRLELSRHFAAEFHVEGPENLDSKKELDKAVYRISTLYLIRVLDAVLQRISSLSQGWSQETIEWLNERGWQSFPKSSEEFVKKVEEYSSFSKKLEDFCGCPINKIGSERNLFADLVNIFNILDQFYWEYSIIK